MSTNHRSRSLVFGIATVFALTLLAPVAVTAEDDVTVLAPVAAPSVEDTSAGDVRATRVLAAQRALLTGDIGSMQEEHLLAIVAAGPSWDETSGYGSVEASRATNALPAAPAASTTAEETRALAAQQALQSPDLGSLQEEALLAVVAPGASWDQASGYQSVEVTHAMIGHPAASTTSEETRVIAAQQALLSHDLGSLQEDALTAVVEASLAEADASVDAAVAPTYAHRLAQFRAVELAQSRFLGTD